jgi:hypothetical protein
MKRWLLKVETSNPLKGTITVPLHEEAYARGALKRIEDHISSGAVMYSLAGHATLDLTEVVRVYIEEHDDGTSDET